jgi:hypothetical protein
MTKWRRFWWVVPVVAVLAGYWLLPISGRVLVIPGEGNAGLWPYFDFEGQPLRQGEVLTVHVTDIRPWPFVHLLVGGTPAIPEGKAIEQAGTWTWTWHVNVPSSEGYDIAFYHDCHTGCRERGRTVVGAPPVATVPGLPTKLGVVMPHPDRDWRGRSGWAVEIAYAQHAEEAYWGVDDLAGRVADQHARGLRVLIRVEYAQDQSLPPVGDYVALAEHLAFCRRLARDARLHGVYGYIVGSDFNTLAASALAPDRATTPEWYARVFNGYGEPPTHTDNVLQVVRREHPTVRVIVGPLRPWAIEEGDASDYEGAQAPWLAYMDAMVSLLDASAQAKAAAGVPLAAPDGFDVQAPGRPDAPEMAGTLRAAEPATSLPRGLWGGAEAGFRIYKDWMAIINAYPTTRGLPVYIVSTNTYDRESETPPAQNYPQGWLTTALQVIDAEPQVHALVWFLDDFPHGDEWDWFSLSQRPGRLVDAAAEFDALLELP